ncbi:MAG: hypothetical protein U5R30_06590 [Deltaproteobacteria bacterium]|nr:hypothetical protein [Deltaproteobacteria bacterium]
MRQTPPAWTAQEAQKERRACLESSIPRPKSFAVILGLPSKELSIALGAIQEAIDFGFKGEVRPINPKAEEIRGIKAINRSAGSYVVHMAILLGSSRWNCGRKGVKNIIINLGGSEQVLARPSTAVTCRGIITGPPRPTAIYVHLA